ncbi:DUF3027 domain-containing protein [Arthrobacter pigmenti]
MIWTLKKLVARRSARKASAPESSPSKQAVGVEAAEPAGQQADDAEASQPAAGRADAVETAEQAANAEDALEGAGSAASMDTKPADGDTGTGDTGTQEQPAAKPAKRRRAPKLDPLLAAEVDTGRTAVLDVAPEAEVGEHAGVRAEDDRVVTHLFESNVRGYKGWQWFAVLARVPRGKAATVSEVGLLPSERSLLSPEWIPWAERVRPEEKQAEAEAEAGQFGDGRNSDEPSGGGQGGTGQKGKGADVDGDGGFGGH